MSEESLGTKLGNAWRESAGDQAKAYTKYAALLDRFAKKEVDLLDFGRDALDIYADAFRDVTQIGGRMANDTVSTGLDKLRAIRKREQVVKPTEVVVNRAPGRPKPNA